MISLISGGVSVHYLPQNPIGFQILKKYKGELKEDISANVTELISVDEHDEAVPPEAVPLSNCSLCHTTNVHALKITREVIRIASPMVW